MPTLTFSETYGITLNGSEEWFDPCLILDSPLCIDPFLMLDLEKEDDFKGAHSEIVDFFTRQFARVARGGTDLNSPAIQGVIRVLHMPEAREFYLGYSEGTDGAGSGGGLAKLMVQAMMSSIAAGLQGLQHFEEISILGDGIGPDRISDATAGITKWRFAKYTERICAALGIPLQTAYLDRARYDLAGDRWTTVEAKLPLNPRNGRPILLAPQRFLRHLPTLGGDEFAKFAQRKWCDAHRDELDRKLISFDQKKVLDEARKDASTRKQFMEMAVRAGGNPYDFARDPWGITMPALAANIVATQPFEFSPPKDGLEMKRFVISLAKYFKHFIEEQKGWELLWDRNRPKPEKAVQRLMFGIVFQICAAKNVNVDPEPNAGRGPVDFKFSSGFHAKCLLETKLARNTKWIEGVIVQLPTYIVSDVGKYGVYLLVTYDPANNTENIEKLTKAARLAAAQGIEIDVMVVDATRDKPSASKL